MKKLLIISLFLLSMIGLIAQGTPFNQIFVLETADGNVHAQEFIGFHAVEYHTSLNEMWDMIYSEPQVELEWQWNGANSDNLQTVNYDPVTGELTVQMAPMIHWGGMVLVNFTFIDGEGNEFGPVTVSKPDSGANQVHPDVIAWGGPVGPTPVLQWATVVAPLDGAMDVALDTDLAWAYPEAGDEVLAADGFEVWVNGSMVYDGPNLTYAHNLAYETPYTWYVKPYTNTEAKRGMKASRLKEYPEGEVTEWTFTTMDEPIVYPNWATNATPVNEATDVALMPTLTWTYDGPEVDGYEIWVDGVDLENDVTELEYTFTEELAYNSEYTWGVRPFINVAPEGKATKGRPVFVKRYPEEGTVPTTTFTTTAVYEDEDPVIIPGENNPNNVTVQVQVTFTGGTPAGFTPPVPVPFAQPVDFSDNFPLAGAFNFGAVVNPTENGTYVFTFTTDILQGAVYVGGEYQFDAAFPGGLVTVTIDYDGAKEPIDIIITEPTLPVELSDFTAQAHANEYVTLKWVTESESNLHGYNVYRAETENQDQAIRINPTVVAANNQTQTQTYTYTDNEVEATTYYYWLEVSELSNENSFHGPIVVTVEDDPVVPGITETVFRNFGPSPFSESTSTSLRVKEGETATVTIYNLLGQVVSRESFNAGEHNFEFNGRDLNNKKVANGIYFVRMTSPTQSRSFKIVKMK